MGGSPSLAKVAKIARLGAELKQDSKDILKAIGGSAL
jgi:hypothetical protein